MEKNRQITATLTSEKGLEQALTEAGVKDPATVIKLIVTGPLTEADIEFIRENMGKSLQQLDMSGASFTDNALPRYAFGECSALATVKIPDTVTIIYAGAFCRCTGLTSISIPDSVIEIGGGIFNQCTGLKSITIPYSLTTIHSTSFPCSMEVSPDHPVFATENGVLFNRDKTVLIEYPYLRQGDYAIPDSVVKIGKEAFSYCTGLTSVVIPGSVVEIAENAFEQCENLTSISIPESVKLIGSFAFYDTGLTSVTIPDSITKIDATSFSCPIEVSPDHPVFTAENGILFNKDKTILHRYPRLRKGDYNIPGSVVEIGESAFERCDHLTAVTIPDSVVVIGKKAFGSCHHLKSVKIPASVRIIEKNAFLDCEADILVHPDNPFNFITKDFF